MVFYFSSAELAAYIFPADGEKPDGTIVMNAEYLKGTKDEKCAIRYNLLDNKTAFTSKKDFRRECRDAQWAISQRTFHGLQAPETSNIFNEKISYRELYEIAEQAMRRAEVARLREVLTLKGHMKSVAKLKGLDIDTIQQHYTV